MDTANAGGGAWPAGSAATRATMERKSGLLSDSVLNWLANATTARNGRDGAGSAINGSPRRANSAGLPPLPTATNTATAEPTASPVPTARPATTGVVLINEVAWMGTLASGSDEWIELFNPGPAPIDLNGWTLTSSLKLNIALRGMIAPGAYFLLERTDDRSVADIPADQVYSGALSNGGEMLALRDAAGSVLDTANPAGGAWPAGYAQARFSMERVCNATGRPAGSPPARVLPMAAMLPATPCAAHRASPTRSSRCVRCPPACTSTKCWCAPAAAGAALPTQMRAPSATLSCITPATRCWTSATLCSTMQKRMVPTRSCCRPARALAATSFMCCRLPTADCAYRQAVVCCGCCCRMDQNKSS